MGKWLSRNDFGVPLGGLSRIQKWTAAYHPDDSTAMDGSSCGPVARVGAADVALPRTFKRFRIISAATWRSLLVGAGFAHTLRAAIKNLSARDCRARAGAVIRDR
jgi:hypothetical protein